MKNRQNEAEKVLQNHKSKLDKAYYDLVIIGEFPHDCEAAIDNRKKAKEIEDALCELDYSTAHTIGMILFLSAIFSVFLGILFSFI